MKMEMESVATVSGKQIIQHLQPSPTIRTKRIERV
jgi:hypothetical protein